MLAKYIIFILFYFAITKSFAQAADGLRLNVRLYPVQMLAIGSGFSDDGNESSFREVQSVTISSPTGFQLNAKYDEYRGTIGNSESNREKFEEYPLINHSKGVVQEQYPIQHEIENAMENLSVNRSDDENFLILTLISQ